MNEDLKKTVGNRIKKIRKALGFTQEKMVTFFKIGRANYSRVEKGDVSPQLETLFVLQTKFNVSLDWLIANSGKMFLREKGQKDVRERFDFDHYTDEIIDLLSHIEKVPMLKHAVLSFFHEYKTKHHDIIQQFFEEHESLLENKIEEGIK